MFSHACPLAVLFSIVFLYFAEAIQPLKNLQVSCLGQELYTINDVSTVDELVETLRRRALPNDVKTSDLRVIHKGRILNVGETLREVGVLDGARLVVVLNDTGKMKMKEFVALFLAMISEEGWDRIGRELQEHPELRNDVRLSWNRVQSLTGQDIYASFRDGLDRSYHGLRAWWERPNFRTSFTDHEKIEAYRKLFLFHLSPRIVNDVPWLKETIHSRARWRSRVTKVAAFILRTGDVVLDGILAILLDVLKGNGSDFAMRGDFPSRGPKFETSMEDPNFENLLFELSDSDTDS